MRGLTLFSAVPVKMVLAAIPLATLALATSLAPFAGTSAAAQVAPAPAVSSTSSPYASLPAKASALVTVRFVLETRMASAVRESDDEIDCLVIDRSGLILCPHLEMGGQMMIMSRLFRRQGEGASSQAREIRVYPQDDSAGIEAEVIAQDSDRGLVWLQTTSAFGAEIEVVDFAAGVELPPGDEIYLVRRMDDFFGKAPVVVGGRVAALIDQPRRLVVPTPEVVGYPGMPIFSADGRPVGVLTVQFPGVDDGGLSGTGGLPGQHTPLMDMIGGVILPAADIARATRLAREVHAADLEERTQ